MPYGRNIRVLVTIVLLTIAFTSHPAAPQTSSPAVTADEPLRIAFHRDDGSLTPFTFEHGYSLMTLIYDTLLWRDREGNSQPWLASSIEREADTRFTVRLGDGARWHDGRPVEAEDVVFTFQYLKERYHRRFTPQLLRLRSVSAPDPATVVFNLTSPDPGFPDLALTDVPILPKHLWEGLAATEVPQGLPVGSGPYRLSAYVQGDGYVFTAADDYFRGAPAVKQVEVLIIPTTEERLQAIERGGVDMTPVPFPRRAATRVGRVGTVISEGPGFAPTMLLLNTRQPPFDDVVARQLVSIAMNLKRASNAIGRAVPAGKGLIHPESQWAPGEDLHVFDRDEARRGFSDLRLPPIEIMAPTNDLVQLEAGEQAAISLRQAGAEAEMVRRRENDLISSIGGTGREPTFTAAIWTGHDLPSFAPQFLRSMFGPDIVGSPYSYSGLWNSELAIAFNAMSAAQEMSERQAAVESVLRAIHQQAPVVPLAFSNRVFAYKQSAYSGWGFIKGRGILDKRSFVEPQVRPPGPAGSGSGPAPQPSSSPAFRIIAIGLAAIAISLVVREIVKRR
ncbi:MAG: ABC transporter substrate-binding protein [Actinobacteria bacterium]|nr:ABC transporter substrate-binding protein [Actinomycetota bacterium]